MIVGTRFDDDQGDSSGTAAIFRKTANGWAHEATLKGLDVQANDQFGAAVAIVGDWAFVSAPTYEDLSVAPNPDIGAVYVFRKVSGNWVQTQRITSPNPATNDQFGSAIAVSGSVLAIGTIKDSHATQGTKQGAVYVYRLTGSTWIFAAKLTAPVTFSFGCSVAISPDGTKIIVGANNENSTGAQFGGAAHLFTGTNWVTRTRIIANDIAPSIMFGQDVAAGNEYFAVGAPNLGPGAVYIFNLTGQQMQKLTASDGASGDRFGGSLSMAGDTLAIGARQDGPPLNAGSVYVFSRAMGTWVQTDKLTASPPASSENFGQAVSASGSDIAIGAPGYGSAPFKAGRAWVFTSGTTPPPPDPADFNNDGAVNTQDIRDVCDSSLQGDQFKNKIRQIIDSPNFVR